MAEPPRRRYELQHQELNQLIEELVHRAQELYGESEDGDYVRQIVVSAIRMIRDRASRGDLKLINSTLKELRHSFRVFAPYRHLRKVAVFGSARTSPDHPDWKQAYDFAERMAAEGWMTITGAGDGIMGAAQGGAGREASFGVNIRLPFEQRANEIIAGDHKLISFRYFFTRKVMFVKEAHAIALFPGGFGTHDEGFEALTLIQTGKSEILPIVFIDEPGGSYWKDWAEYLHSHLNVRSLIHEADLGLFRITDSSEEAVQEILNFYSNYHSSRYVGDELVVRVREAPDGETLERLNRDFKGILKRGAIVVHDSLPRENGELPHLPRVCLHFDRRSHGALRLLLDELNEIVAVSESPPRGATPHEIVSVAMPQRAEDEEQSED